jgi:hypothetical protein
MELNVKIDSLTKKPHLFLDCDGVIADFFGAWAEMHHVPSYKDIEDPEKAINDLAASGPESVYNFFLSLKPLSGGIQLRQWLNKHSVPFTVLSAPLRGEPQAAIAGKKAWLDIHVPGTSQYAIFTSGKHKYAMKDGHPQVLVDDFGRYLALWDEHGGIAVKHEDANTPATISVLEKIYLPR